MVWSLLVENSKERKLDSANSVIIGGFEMTSDFMLLVIFSA